MQLRVLGPVEVSNSERTVVLTRRRERCLLGVLLLELNRVVATDRLIDLLWNSEPPDRARRMLHSHVSRIRSQLVAMQAMQHGVEITSTGDGYRISGEPQALDAHRFRTLLDRAVGGQPSPDRIGDLEQALQLWRGPALDNAADEPLRRRLCAELEERRLLAVELLMTDGLALRGAQAMLPELARVVAAHPGHERLVELHMRALHRCGRKGEALQVFSRTRSFMATHLGLDPGPALQQLQQQILRDEAVPEPTEQPQSVTLTAPASTRTPARAGTPAPADTAAQGHTVPRQLPADVAGFAGRDEELDTLDAVLAASGARGTTVSMAVISGTAGVGKTTLALHCAHRISDRFPDGQLHLDLRGFDAAGAPVSPQVALRSLLGGLGVPVAQLPADTQALSSLYRSLTAGKRMLVLLDNARDAAQVRPLVPGGPGCAVIVTSRDHLSGLVAAAGATPVVLNLMSHADGRRLLEHRLGNPRVAAEPAAADEIVRRCARLPLALAVVAARAATRPAFPLTGIVDELRQAHGALDIGHDTDGALDLRTVFSWSYRALTPPAARLFRLLGTHPGPDVPIAAAASLAGTTPPQARQLLAQLAAGHLVAEHAPGRFVLHDLLRDYAAELAASHDTAQLRYAQRRMVDHYLHHAHRAALALDPHRTPVTPPPPTAGAVIDDTAAARPEEWLATECPALFALIRHAAVSGFHTHAWQLGWALLSFVDRCGYWEEYADVLPDALSAAGRHGDLAGVACTHRTLGWTLARLGRYDDAEIHLRAALDAYRELDDAAGVAHSHYSLAMACQQRGDAEASLSHAREALAAFEHADNRVGQARALAAIGGLYARSGDVEQMRTHCRAALRLQQELGDRLGQAHAWSHLGYAEKCRGAVKDAARSYRRAVQIYREVGDRYGEATNLEQLGDTYHVLGHRDAAERRWRRALDILTSIGHADAETLRSRLAGARDHT